MAAEIRRPLGAAQEIGASEELTVEEGCLIDHARTRAHRGERLPLSVPIRVDAVLAALELNDAVRIYLPQAFKMGELVLLAFAAEQFRLLVLPIRPLQRSPRDERLEIGETLALEVIIEVACGVKKP